MKTDLQTLDQRIAQMERDIETLRQAKLLLLQGTGTPAPPPPAPTKVRSARGGTKRGKAPAGRLTVAQASVKILQRHPQLHLNELLKELSTAYGIKTTAKNLSKRLLLWGKKNKTFKRVAPSVFAYIPPKAEK